MKPEKIVIIGTGRLPCRCLEACLSYSLPVACVETGDHAFSPLAALCRKRKVEYIQMLDSKRLSQFFLSIHQPTLVVSAYNYFIFPQEVLKNPVLNIINFHNSLLPYHRGRNAPTWSIFEMDQTTGITWHQVHPAVDKGDIIAQRQIPITSEITAIELTLKTLEVAALVFEEILPSLLDNSYVRKAVESNGKGSFHRSTDVPNGGLLDLKWSVKQAHAFLRAVDYGKFKVFDAPKIHLLGTTFSIAGYEVQRTNFNLPETPSIAFQRKQLFLRDPEMELLIVCE